MTVSERFFKILVSIITTSGTVNSRKSKGSAICMPRPRCVSQTPLRARENVGMSRCGRRETIATYALARWWLWFSKIFFSGLIASENPNVQIDLKSPLSSADHSLQMHICNISAEDAQITPRSVACPALPPKRLFHPFIHKRLERQPHDIFDPIASEAISSTALITLLSSSSEMVGKLFFIEAKPTARCSTSFSLS